MIDSCRPGLSGANEEYKGKRGPAQRNGHKGRVDDWMPRFTEGMKGRGVGDSS